MLCYVMTRILGTGGDAKGRRSPGVYCTSLGRLGGIKPARRTDCCLEQARNGGTARDRNAERAEGNSQLAVTASPLGRVDCASGRASLWTALTATVSPARGSKSESPLGGEVAHGTGAKPA